MEAERARGFTYMNARDRVDVATQEEKVNDNISDLGMHVCY